MSDWKDNAQHRPIAISATGGDRGTVVVTAPGFDVDDEGSGGRLQQHGFAIAHAGPKGNRQPGEVAELVGDAVAAIVSSDPFTEAVFAAAPRLRVIARLGVGTDSIDLDSATKHGVVVTTTPGLNDETCADHALALLLAAVRRVVEHDASVRRGEWDRGGALTAWDLHGKRVGVIGYGRIGRRVVRRLRGFETEIRVFDPQADVDGELACGDLNELLSWADVVTLHIPLTSKTNGLIGTDELAMMKPDAILVSTARGGLVDEVALLHALEGGQLRAAALDVFVEEPPRSPALWRLPNIVVSPHIGGLSAESMQAMTRRCVHQILDILDERMPHGVVNPEALAMRS